MTTTSAALSTDSGVSHPRLRPFLLADAATTTANGLAYLVAAGWLADGFGAPEALLRGIGAFLLVFGAGVAVLASRRPVPRRAVLVLSVLNGLWVVASLDYALLGDLTAVGATWAVLQAVVVGGFAAGQAWFARRG